MAFLSLEAWLSKTNIYIFFVHFLNFVLGFLFFFRFAAMAAIKVNIIVYFKDMSTCWSFAFTYALQFFEQFELSLVLNRVEFKVKWY